MLPYNLLASDVYAQTAIPTSEYTWIHHHLLQHRHRHRPQQQQLRQHETGITSTYQLLRISSPLPSMPHSLFLPWIIPLLTVTRQLSFSFLHP